MRQPIVMVVEDDPGMSQLVELLLRSKGYAVISVASGEKALAALGENGAIELLLTDFQLGRGMNGLELAGWVQRENAAVKVLVMSGTAECEGLAKARGWPFLQKPFTPAILLEQVQRLVAEALAGGHAASDGAALVEERVTRSRRVTGEVEGGASRPRSPQSPGKAPRRKRPGRAGECREGRGRDPAGRRRSGRRGGAAA